METIQRLCTWIKVLTGFAMLFVAIWVIFYQPYLIQSQPYTLLHWAGIGIVLIVIAQKISDYTHIFTNPQQSLLSIFLQFLFVPIFTDILMRYFHFPATLALAFSLAAFSPGALSHTVLKTLFIAGCVFFLDWIGFYSPMLNQGVDMVTDNRTKYILLVIAFVPVLYHEYRKYRMKHKPVQVIHLEDEDQS